MRSCAHRACKAHETKRSPNTSNITATSTSSLPNAVQTMQMLGGPSTAHVVTACNRTRIWLRDDNTRCGVLTNPRALLHGSVVHYVRARAYICMLICGAKRVCDCKLQTQMQTHLLASSFTFVSACTLHICITNTHTDKRTDTYYRHRHRVVSH